MPIFIICSLTLTLLVRIESQYLPLLFTQTALLTTASLATLCLLGGMLKKIPIAIWHDGFASALLLFWYGHWRPMPLFNAEAPLFHVFPLYLMVISAWFTWVVINKSPRFDYDTRETLRYVETLARVDTWVLAIVVGLSLLTPEQFLFFPSAMTLFIVRFTLVRCLEIINSADGQA